MKKLILILTVAIILLLTCGCGTTTITEHEGNYIYAQSEDINILDIDTRNNIGTLKLTGAEVLKNQSFTIKETNGTDESGNDIYQDVTYEQLVQVFYLYDSKDSGKSISSSNFYVYDSTGTYCKRNPDIEYSVVKRKGEQYFVVALKNKSDFININFNYNLMQTTNTAKIKLNISNKPDSASSQNESASLNSASSQNESASSNSNSVSGLSTDNRSSGINTLILYSIISVLLLAVLVLIIVIIAKS